MLYIFDNYKTVGCFRRHRRQSEGSVIWWLWWKWAAFFLKKIMPASSTRAATIKGLSSRFRAVRTYTFVLGMYKVTYLPKEAMKRPALSSLTRAMNSRKKAVVGITGIWHPINTFLNLPDHQAPPPLPPPPLVVSLCRLPLFFLVRLVQNVRVRSD